MQQILVMEVNMSELTASKLLEEASKNLNVNGWCIGRLQDDYTGKMCIMGAIIDTYAQNDVYVDVYEADSRRKYLRQASYYIYKTLCDVYGGDAINLIHKRINWSTVMRSNDEIIKSESEAVHVLEYASKLAKQDELL